MDKISEIAKKNVRINDDFENCLYQNKDKFKGQRQPSCY